MEGISEGTCLVVHHITHKLSPALTTSYEIRPPYLFADGRHCIQLWGQNSHIAAIIRIGVFIVGETLWLSRVVWWRAARDKVSECRSHGSLKACHAVLVLVTADWLVLENQYRSLVFVKCVDFGYECYRLTIEKICIV